MTRNRRAPTEHTGQPVTEPPTTMKEDTDMMNEALRAKLANNETAYGLWVTSEAPAVTEVAALLDLDWICIDMEHGYIDYKSIAGHLSAAKGSNLSVFVRPPSQDLEPIKRALDLGAHGIILPLVDTVEEIEDRKSVV